ncbi:radical SAM protein [Cetobacterium sp.]
MEKELIILLPVGCYWVRKYGGCSYCGYQHLVNELQNEYYYDLLEIVKNEYEKNKNKNITRISFFVGGSFFEINSDIQEKIIKYIIGQESINEIFIESRPELITDSNLVKLKNLMGNRKLTIAIGLETSSETIRNLVHTKGITNKSYEEAMKKLTNNKIDSLIYIFIKPPIKNYSDQEAYEEAVTSIEYAIKHGATSLELESGYIVENSKMHELYEQGLYTPLNLWTINQILLTGIKKHPNIPIRLAYFTDTPEPIDGPKGCIDCDTFLKNKFQEYRESLDMEILIKTSSCKCSLI